MNVLARFIACGNRNVAPARRAAADKYGIEFLLEQRAHRIDTSAAAKFDALIENVADLFVDHAVRQTKFGNLRAHHSARQRIAVEDDALISERREIARNRQ